MPPTLHLICGKIAAGKSTLATRLGREAGTVVLSEDAWLAALFGGEIETVADYVRVSARLRSAMGPHVEALLAAGVSVVLDFPANTVETRGWMRGIVGRTQADHVMHVLDVPDAVCRARLHARNDDGTHPFAVTDAQFDRVTAAFEMPTEAEGFVLRHHRITE